MVSSSRFKKDLKITIKRGYNMELMESIVNQLSNNKKLPPLNKDHVLIGDYGGCRECHITPDWILIYEVENDELILYPTRTGTHSDLF
ncbi:type II toxin-antitoxin system YafQ family toxin [Pectinatus frisingensis]|uniref:type II toxin-antitoxin system YafQ family toxin n=1 Tax=Pectinatus frisingensis TaxID=865 RepID=UPI0018C482CF